MEQPQAAIEFELARRAVLDALGGFRVVLDPQLRVVDASHEARQVMGDRAWGLSCFAALKKSGEPCPDCPARHALESGETVWSREELLADDGSRREVPVAATPLRSAQDQVVGVLLSQVEQPADELQRELAKREAAWHTLFEEVPCYVTVQDRDYRILHANRLFRENFGEPERDRPLHCHDLYKHRDEPCLPCPVAVSFNDGGTQRSEGVVINKWGELANVLVVTTPLPDPSGEVTQVMKMSTDITEIHKAQSQLEALGMVVGQIAHEIKGVLNGLDGGVYMVSTGMQRHDTRRLEQGWEMVRRNVDKVRTLVLDILYYAKDREPDYHLASPIRVVEEVVQRFEPKAAEHGIELVSSFDPGAIRFQVDVRAIQALLTNLLENALDACRAEPTRERHTIEFAVRDEPEDAIFVISDDGVGMDSEAKKRAFTAFFSSKGSSGTGLGLHIAQRIAAQHGGGIEVESELGRGTTFSVRIPKRAVRRTPDPANSAPPPLRVDPPMNRPMSEKGLEE
jgi:signal transduction histidine kinase